jgi:hypothetical protein
MQPQGGGGGVEAPPIIELRVHGIGDHQQWSSMGSVRVLDEDPRTGLAVVRPPPIPVHTVLLFNWSRVTRRVLRLLWYLAFPFTLLNLAEQMRPVGSRWAANAHWTLVRFASISLTVLTTVWVLSAAEKTALLSNREFLFGIETPHLFLWLSAVAMMLIPLVRAFKSETPLQLRASVLHVAIIAAVTFAVDVVRPARALLSLNSYFIAHASYGLDVAGQRTLTEYLSKRRTEGETLRLEQYPYLDGVGLTSYFCVFGVLAAAAIFAILALPRKGEQAPAPMVGSAVAVAISSLFGLLTLTALFHSLPTLIAPLLRLLPDGPGYQSIEQRTYLLPDNGQSAPDVALPLVALVLIIIFGCTVLAFARFRPSFFIVPAVEGIRSRLRKSPPSSRAGERIDRVLLARMHWSHKLFGESLPAVLNKSLIIFVVALEGLAFLLIRQFMDRVSRDNSHYFQEWQGGRMVSPEPLSTLGDRVMGIGVAVSVAVGFWLVAKGASGPLRSIFASAGDVAGFWPITVSPFGGRSYRGAVVGKLAEVIHDLGRRNVVLVGHSQGSVIAAWYANALGTAQTDEDAPPRLRGLVTCGSPVASLYGRFFPRTFSPKFMTDTRQGCEAWENFWRETDPIATRLGPPCDDHDPLRDPADEGNSKPSGHSDYWTDPVQRDAVKRLVMGDRAQTNSTAPPS